MELPSINPVQLALAIPTSILNGSIDICLPVAVEPLLPKRCQKSSEQRGAQGCVKYGLGLADGGFWAGPAWRRDWLTGRDISNGGIQEEFQERVVHFLVVGLEF